MWYSTVTFEKNMHFDFTMLVFFPQNEDKLSLLIQK